MFETTGTIDSQALQKLFKESMPNWYRIIQNIPLILLFSLAAYATATHMVIHAGVYLIFAMLFLTITRGRIKNEATKTLKRMKKITGHDTTKYLTRFEENGIYTQAVGTKYFASVPYEDIVRKQVTQEFIILFTQKKENIFVFKNQLSKDQQIELLNFLNIKIPHFKNL